ncbi:FeoA family protein [Pseudoalteromonas viridis]|uniref:Ferrous iron transport protein A n=1 Tax=Pseudoalteromonas viridis TaxID=339617 RepID=A0ABX7V717_9GAMM|nr:FeoA family protein [Pseudoalteromonas viridis]QTL34458.1 ferrous iron transport protein A [Pseudoalteromonas viridis]
MTLADLKPNDTAIIAGIEHPDAALISRVMALGLIPGEAISVLNIAPLGCPIQTKVGNTYISIRKTDARFIQLSR